MTAVIGALGFIGSHYLKAVVGAMGFNRHDFDLLQPDLQKIPKGITHLLIAGGMGNPLKCEENPKESYRCNVTGTLEVANGCLERGITPIVFSTDYVFDGKKEEYHEGDLTSPVNEYGRQKAELEAQAPQGTLIVRLSKVYGDVGLIAEMERDLREGKVVRAARDQVFRPLYIDDCIQAIIELQKRKSTGLFHLAGVETVTRYELALRVAKRLGKSHLVQEIALDDLGETFQRPKKTVLCTAKFRNEIQLPFRSIEEALKRYGHH